MSPAMNGVGVDPAFDTWATPAWLVAQLSEEFGPFELDPAATPTNAKAPRFYTREQDGLKQPWEGRVFLNPPYGPGIGLWMRKAWESARGGALVVCVIPCRPDTEWWHGWVMRGEIRFIKGRLQYGASRTSAPFSSCVVIFRPGVAQAEPRIPAVIQGFPSSPRML